MKNGQLTAIEEGSAFGIILSPSERVVLVAGMYRSTDNLSLQFLICENGWYGPFTSITENHEPLSPYMAYIRTAPENSEMLKFILTNGIGYVVSRRIDGKPGVALVQLDEEMLKKFIFDGLETYQQHVEDDFCGKIDWLGADGRPGDTVYYRDQERFKTDRHDSWYCGNPHIAKEYLKPKRSIKARIDEAAHCYEAIQKELIPVIDGKSSITHRQERIDSEDCGRPITLMYDMEMVVNRMKSAVLNFNERKICMTSKDSKQERITHHSDR